MSHIAVIGAGITGITTAYALLDKGHRVTVIERHRYAAMETSFANGGQLSASNAEVWNQSSTILKAIKWMLRKDAPLLLNPKPSWHKLSWLTEFVANIPNYRSNTIKTTRLAIAARAHLFEMAQRENIEFSVEHRGILHMYRDAESFRTAERSNELLREGGLVRDAVTPSEMRSIEPALPDYLYGGFYTESDASGDIHSFTRALADACQRRGAALLTQTSVDKLHASNDSVDLTLTNGDATQVEQFDKVVVCAGVESRRLASQAGDRVNIYPVKGYSITANLHDEASRSAAPWVSLLDEGAKVVSSRLGNDRFRVAGTAELNGFNRDIRMDRVAPLVDWISHLFPGMDTSDIRPWAGLRPMTPNMVPKVGRGKAPTVYYNTGHGHLGWTLGPATAYMVSEVISDERPATRARARPPALA
jgi:D-amino-acid dehydrogenase